MVEWQKGKKAKRKKHENGSKARWQADGTEVNGCGCGELQQQHESEHGVGRRQKPQPVHHPHPPQPQQRQKEEAGEGDAHQGRQAQVRSARTFCQVAAQDQHHARDHGLPAQTHPPPPLTPPSLSIPSTAPPPPLTPGRPQCAPPAAGVLQTQTEGP